MLAFDTPRVGIDASNLYAVSSDLSNVLRQRVEAMSRLQYALHIVVTAGFKPATITAVFVASSASVLPPALETGNEGIYYDCKWRVEVGSFVSTSDAHAALPVVQTLRPTRYCSRWMSLGRRRRATRSQSELYLGSGRLAYLTRPSTLGCLTRQYRRR